MELKGKWTTNIIVIKLTTKEKTTWDKISFEEKKHGYKQKRERNVMMLQGAHLK